MQRCNVASVARPPDLVPLPEDFQPDAKTRAVLNERLGEASAAVLTTNYCDHFWSHPEVLDTPGGWQSRLRKWARSERKQRDGPAQFALVRPMSGGRASVRVPSKPDDPLWAPVYEKLAAELGEAIAADWFRSVRFELCDGKATLQLPNPFLRQWIESHYDGQVSRAITAVHGAVKVNFSAQQRRESG